MSFDLNIDNYTRGELIEMFELPEKFDRNIVEIKEAKLRDNIINNKYKNLIKSMIELRNKGNIYIILLVSTKKLQKLTFRKHLTLKK